MSRNVEVMWRAGSRVIGRNAPAHADCRACREARRAGFAGFSLTMRPLLRDVVRSPGGKLRAAGILLRNPVLLVRQLRLVFRIKK